MTSDDPIDSVDNELKVISGIRDLLGSLQPDQRSRVLGYAISAWGGSGQSQAVNSPLVETAGAIDSRRILASKKPASDIERVLVLAQCLTLKGEPRFDSSQLAEERIAAAGSPFNVIEAAKSAVKKGYFAAAGEGKRQLTVLGEEVADALPDREAVGKLLLESGRRQTGPRRRR